MSEPPVTPEMLLNYIQSLEARISTSVSAKEPKISNPEKFSGKMSDAKNFVAVCRDIIALQPSRFPDERSKIIFVGTNFVGNALTWYRNVRMEHEWTANPELATIERFFELILYTFDDPNSVYVSRDQLSRIKQGNESCLSYTTRFRNVAIETGYNEVAKVALFRNGLNDSLKDALANMQSLPETFEQFSKLAITLDNRQYQRRVEHRKFHGPQPMQLDTITTPGLSLKKELKEYRMKNGLCLYCGERGHLLKECGKRPKNGEPRREKRIS